MIPEKVHDQKMYWVVELNPTVTGIVEGGVVGESVGFYLVSASGPGSVAAEYSTDKGATWNTIPLGEPLLLAAPSAMWRLDVPPETQIQFLIGISSI